MPQIRIPVIHLTPAQLDAQSPVRMSEWIDIHSERARQIDDMYSITLKWMRIAVEGNILFADRLGRLWGKTDKVGIYSPYHFEYGASLIGYRVSAQASN